MRISLLCLELAARSYLSNGVGDSVRQCFLADRVIPASLHPMISPVEAGLLLGAALVSGDPRAALDAVRTTRLTEIEFDHPENGFRLPAEALNYHPSFQPWIGTSLADAVSKLLLAGALYTNFAPTAPSYGDLEIAAGSDGLEARQEMQFALQSSVLNVIAHYGDATGEPGRRPLVRVGAQAISNVGATARALTSQNVPDEGANTTNLGVALLPTATDRIH